MQITLEEARQWYADADPIHDFDHVLRVYQMANRIAAAEGADTEIVLAAALLHDASGAAPGSETRASHQLLSAEIAQNVLQAKGWPAVQVEAVLHCIRAHRFRSNGETPQTLEAKVLFDADKLDVLGAIGVARVIGYAALHGQPAFATPSQRFLRNGEKEPGEPHSSYHEHLFKLRKVKDRLFTSTAKAIAEERTDYLEAYFQRLQEEIAGQR